MQTTVPTNRDIRREELRKRLGLLEEKQREQFRAIIKEEPDNELLADLRYRFGWDKDPKKSSWQAIEINRLIKNRSDRKGARRQWIAIIVSGLLSLFSLIVSILAYLHKSTK